MILWYGYPQHNDAYPRRPWWRSDPEENSWIRSDGARRNGVVGEPASAFARTFSGPWYESEEAFEQVLKAYDHNHPLPKPPPLIGQVWHFPDLGLTCLIQGDAWPTVPFVTAGCGGANSNDVPMWPPHGAVLVRGPLSPWAPLDWAFERKK